MNSRLLRMVLLAGAALAVIPAAQAQVAPTHEVRKGDTLFGVARKAKHDGATRNQMILAIYRANQAAFAGGNINSLEVGTVLAVPPRDEVLKIESADADRQVRDLIAGAPGASGAAPQQLAAVKPAAAVKPPAKPAAAAALAAEAAAKRYREGVALERRKDEQGAMTAYMEAGEAGNGLAQRRLGQIYDKGNTVVQRDYQEALKWYQKARLQGVNIDKPLQRTTPH
jgi:pilus assembly protein FimV